MGHRILITGTEGWAIDQVGRQLRQRGHDVLHCHEPGEPAFPCLGLSAGSCVLDHRVDVVLAVRARPLPQPTRHEVVVTCGLRDGRPLVVAGSTVLNPFADHCAGTVEGLDPQAIEEALDRAVRRTGERLVALGDRRAV